MILLLKPFYLLTHLNSCWVHFVQDNRQVLCAWTSQTVMFHRQVCVLEGNEGPRPWRSVWARRQQLRPLRKHPPRYFLLQPWRLMWRRALPLCLQHNLRRQAVEGHTVLWAASSCPLHRGHDTLGSVKLASYPRQSVWLLTLHRWQPMHPIVRAVRSGMLCCRQADSSQNFRI